jgi:hypothetical protein
MLMYVINIFQTNEKSRINNGPFGSWKIKEKLSFGGYQMMQQ